MEPHGAVSPGTARAKRSSSGGADGHLPSARVRRGWFRVRRAHGVELFGDSASGSLVSCVTSNEMAMRPSRIVSCADGSSLWSAGREVAPSSSRSSAGREVPSNALGTHGSSPSLSHKSRA